MLKEGRKTGEVPWALNPLTEHMLFSLHAEKTLNYLIISDFLHV